MVSKILDIKHVIGDIGILQIKILKVPVDEFHPEGIKYSLIFVRKLENGSFDNEFLRYDNYNKEGHHKHIKGNKIKYDFVNVETLVEDFKKDLKKLLEEEGIYLDL